MADLETVHATIDHTGITGVGGGGGSLTAVSVALTADRAITGDSAYHDITDLTGISLTAGTWMGFIDIAVTSSGDCAFNIRVIDGSSNKYAEQEFVYKNVFNITASFHTFIQPFVLGGSATLKAQGWSGAGFTVKKIADQGTSPTSILSKVTFIKVA